jgi:hypothetical protein
MQDLFHQTTYQSIATAREIIAKKIKNKSSSKNDLYDEREKVK